MSISRYHRILVAVDSAQAYELIRNQTTSLVLLEEDRTGGRIWEVVQEIKRLSPQTKCIVILENVQQQTAGHLADAVILQGTSPEQLVAMIESMLEDSGV